MRRTDGNLTGRQWLAGYVKWRFPMLALYLAVLVIFPLLGYLYGGRMDGIWYGAGLVTLFFCVFSIGDFILFYRKHMALSQCLRNMTAESISLPKAYGLREEDYAAVIGKLHELLKESLAAIHSRNDARMDYYTLWIHQIKTPISALHLLLQSARDKGARTAAMEQELFRIEQYADMVMSYLRMDSLSNDLELAECDLNGILRALMKKYASLFIYKGLSLELEKLPEKVLSDEKWLSLIVEQLVSNAIKYTAKGSIHIYMETAPVALVVEDTGIGIRREDEKRIFERGFTGFNGRLKEKSSGLGLFLAKEAAGKLGHRLEAESQLGAGSRFRIVFRSCDMTKL